jgi:hypothetical protein
MERQQQQQQQQQGQSVQGQSVQDQSVQDQGAQGYQYHHTSGQPRSQQQDFENGVWAGFNSDFK